MSISATPTSVSAPIAKPSRANRTICGTGHGLASEPANGQNIR